MRLLKPFLLLTISLSLSFSIYAQNCKFDEDKKDPFGSGNIRSMLNPIGTRWQNWYFQVEQKNDKYYLGLRIIQEGKINDLWNKGEKIMVKQANGEIFEFLLQEDVIPGYAVSKINGSIWTNYLPKVEITIDDIKKLSTSPVTAVKVTIAKMDLIPAISEKQGKRIMEKSKCFL
jgi:hypothetical protein